ncbi:MAG: hypothetical protein SF053_11760 [Bacteroidia bacterium]|nr:hypothetical protein [Bacteroidia bacterium]
MQLLNFTLNEDLISLTYQGQEIDLHNAWELVDIRHDESRQIVELCFTQYTDRRVPHAVPERLTLLFRQVVHVFYQGHDKDYPEALIKQDQGTIDIMGFSDGDPGRMDSVAGHMPRPELPALIGILVTGSAIKIVAGTVEIVPSDAPA